MYYILKTNLRTIQDVNGRLERNSFISRVVTVLLMETTIDSAMERIRKSCIQYALYGINKNKQILNLNEYFMIMHVGYLTVQYIVFSVYDYGLQAMI